MTKINLSVAKRLLLELENQIDQLDLAKKDNKVEDSVVEATKAMGLAHGLSQEAMALIGDIQKMLNYNPNMANALQDLFSDLKPKRDKN